MMNSKTKYWVAIDVVLIAAVMVSFLVAKTNVFQQRKALPVFMGEEITVQKATKAMTARKVMTAAKAEVMTVTKAVAQPVAQSKVAAPLPIIPPQVTQRVMPQYPVSALEQGLSGTVMVAVNVGLNGAAQAVEVKTSSGVAELDQAAVAAVSEWKFSPATQGTAALASWFEFPVRFEVQ
jgi:TonB family protein